MAKVTIEFDTEVPEQYNKAVEIMTELGEAAIMPVGIDERCPLPSAPEQTENERLAEIAVEINDSVPPSPPVKFEVNRDVEKVWVPVPPVPETPAVSGHLDTEGLPWDARIHATTRTKRQSDMTWKLKRGIDETLVKQVKAELRGSAIPSVLAGVTPAVPTTTAVSVATTSGAIAPPPPTAMNYVTLIEAITSKQREGTLAVTDVTTACDVVGIDTAADLADRPELIAAFAAELGITC